MVTINYLAVVVLYYNVTATMYLLLIKPRLFLQSHYIVYNKLSCSYLCYFYLSVIVNNYIYLY